MSTVQTAHKTQSYWTNTLQDYTSVKLPTQKYSSKSAQKSNKSFMLEQSFTQKMVEFSRHHNGNLYSFLYLGLVQTLSQITQQKDITIGTFACDQNHNSCKLAIRYKINEKLSNKEQFSQASLNLFKAYEHRNEAFEQFLRTLSIPDQNLFKVTLNLMNESGHNMLYLPSREMKCMSFPCHDHSAEISFSLQHSENGIKGIVRFDSDKYADDFIDSLLFNFNAILKSNLEP